MDISIKNLSKKFNKNTVLDHISLSIQSGAFVTLLGQSGCGKTTTLKIISGILSQDSGEIYFGQSSMKGVPTQARNIGMVFQNYALYPHMSVRENLSFPLKMKKLTKKIIEKNVLKTANFLEINHLLDSKPGQLSGGEQQRVAIGRAIIKNPDVLLMDEPLSNLDKTLRLKMREEIKKIQKQLGITTIFVTHDQEEAFNISDTIFIMKDGKIEQSGSPISLYNNANSLFVARFIGVTPLNEIKGTLSNATLKLQGIKTPYLLHAKNTAIVVATIRANDICLCTPDQSDFVGKITEITFRDPEYLITVSNDNLTLKAYAPNHLALKIGDWAHLSLNEKKFQIFDSESSKIEFSSLKKGNTP